MSWLFATEAIKRKSRAILLCGILSCVLVFFGIVCLFAPATDLVTDAVRVAIIIFSFISSLTLGIIGMTLFLRKKINGCVNKLSTSGFVCSCISLYAIGCTLVMFIFAFVIILLMGYIG